MIEVHCTTNLDIKEDWPTLLPCVPRIGDLIVSQTRRLPNIYRAELEVVSVRLYHNKPPEIELHLPKNRFSSIRNFYEWYAPLVSKTVSSFI